MTVTVRLFATLHDAAGTEACWFELPSGASGLEVQTALRDRYPRLHGLLESSRIARDLAYQSWDTPLHDGDELCVIPPVSGG